MVVPGIDGKDSNIQGGVDSSWRRRTVHGRGGQFMVGWTVHGGVDSSWWRGQFKGGGW